MGPTWDPPGSCRPRWAPCWPHEPCYQGTFTPQRGKQSIEQTCVNSFLFSSFTETVYCSTGAPPSSSGFCHCTVTPDSVASCTARFLGAEGASTFTCVQMYITECFLHALHCGIEQKKIQHTLPVSKFIWSVKIHHYHENRKQINAIQFISLFRHVNHIKSTVIYA